MADNISVEITGATELVAQLSKAASRSIPLIDGVLQHGAVNVKDDMSSEARASAHFKGMAQSISFDKVGGFGFLGREIGPDKDRKGGALGNVAYFGTSRGGGTLDLDGPLEREVPRMLKAFEDGLADLL